MDEDATNWLDGALDVIARAPSIEMAVEGIRDAVGVDHVVYHSSHFGSSPSIDPYIRLTYPATWIKQYLQMDYIKIDPILQTGFLRTLPFLWSEINVEDPGQLRMIADAAAHGVGPLGYSVPIRSKRGHRGLFSVSSSGSSGDWSDFCIRNAGAFAQISQKLHNRVLANEFGEEENHFSNRELECLSWTAQGKDAGEIASILCISIHTVRDYLKSARYKLDCVTLAQAVAKALHTGLIN